MPRAPRQSSPSTTGTRRSSRLNRRPQEIKNNAVVQVPAPLKSKRRKVVNGQITLKGDESTICTSEPVTVDSYSAHQPRRSTRITAPELIKRERVLLAREREIQQRSDELDNRISLLRKKEEETALIVSQIAAREAKATLAHLEEHFTCALCYDILAHPYSLNPGQCGHTFCAICILRHFFSRLHKACGGWHESVDCPMCRSLLVITPERVPRLDITFPFVPNRTAAAACEALIEKLSRSPYDSSPIVKREGSEGLWGSGSEDDLEWGRKKGKSKEEEEEEESSDITAWREGGNLKAEWLKKDREGKKEMAYILKFWPTLRNHDFVALKQKFGV